MRCKRYSYRDAAHVPRPEEKTQLYATPACRAVSCPYRLRCDVAGGARAPRWGATPGLRLLSRRSWNRSTLRAEGIAACSSACCKGDCRCAARLHKTILCVRSLESAASRLLLLTHSQSADLPWGHTAMSFVPVDASFLLWSFHALFGIAGTPLLRSPVMSRMGAHLRIPRDNREAESGGARRAFVVQGAALDRRRQPGGGAVMSGRHAAARIAIMPAISTHSERR
jgi:hypothetical protein